MGKILFYTTVFIALHLLVVLNINNIPLEQINFPLKENPKDYFPSVFYPLAGFDGAHYLLIAKVGYGQFQQAFFPLYPLLINTLSKLFNLNVLLSGLIISLTTLFTGLIFFKKISETILGEKPKSIWAILFLLSFPSAFFYITIYPESLFLFLSCATLYLIFKKHFFLASIFAMLSSLTKIQGVFLIIPFLFSFIELKGNGKLRLKMNFKNLLLSFSPIYGILIYAGYLFITYGDPFYFYHTQEAFGANRTSQNIVFLPQVLFRYLKIFTTAQVNFQYWIALLEFLIFSVVLAVLIFELFRLIKNKRMQLNELSINLYSISVLILPTLTGTLSSIPRYALVSFGFFFTLAKIKNITYKILLVIIFAVMHIILFVSFIKGFFVS